jgi:hypothetical protein
MLISRKLAAGAAGAVGLAVALTTVAPAHADYAGQPGDVLGVGSDTLQNLGNFLFDGKGALPGFNGAGNKNRAISFDATADSNDRAVYGNAAGTASAMKPTVILRAGANPVQRPNGSGAGLAALLADTATPAVINFARMSSLPSSAQQQSAVDKGWGGLHVVKVAFDDLVVGAALTTNAVPVAASDLVKMYKCDAGFTDWNTFNASAPVGSTIVPLVPQTGSGTYNTFNADMTAANGGVAPTYGSCTRFVEENDPAAITSPPLGLAVNAIAPMSSGRKALFDSGYFKDPNTAFPGGSALTSGIQLLYGSAALAQTANACVKPANPAGSGNSLAYCNTRGLHVVWRESDTASSTPMQPGGTRNWVQTLFWRAPGDGTPYAKTSGGQSLIAGAGVTATYKDCGFGTGVTSATC